MMRVRSWSYRIMLRVGFYGGKALRFFCIWILPPLLIVGGAYLFLFSRAFSIQYVDVNTKGDVDPSKIRSIVYDQMDKGPLSFLTQENILLFSEEQLRARLWDAYAIDQLTVHKQYPHTLTVTLTEKPLQALWLSRNNTYVVDAKGIVVKKVDDDIYPWLSHFILERPLFQDPSWSQDELAQHQKAYDDKKKQSEAHPEKAEVPPMPVLIDESNAELQIGSSTIADQDTFQTILAAIQELKKVGIDTLSIHMAANPLYASFKTTEGWSVLVSLISDPAQQAHYLDTVLRTQVKDSRPQLDYVDVRFENRIYFKKK